MTFFMLKKTVLTLVFLTTFTTFYGINGRNGVPATGTLEDSLATAETVVAGYPLLKEGDYVISTYDEMFRGICAEEGHDWRLMSAIAYHESRFQPDVKSRRGARGLMQIMPSVARQFEVPLEEVADPEVNIRLANRLMSKLSAMLRFPAGTPEKDRMSIILASYNGGIGHVNDARRLANYHGENPNSWEVVSRYLALKADSAYYALDVVKCGRFTGSGQTRAYVADVLGRYDKYCRMAKL